MRTSSDASILPPFVLLRFPYRSANGFHERKDQGQRKVSINPASLLEIHWTRTLPLKSDVLTRFSPSLVSNLLLFSSIMLGLRMQQQLMKEIGKLSKL